MGEREREPLPPKIYPWQESADISFESNTFGHVQLCTAPRAIKSCSIVNHHKEITARWPSPASTPPWSVPATRATRFKVRRRKPFWESFRRIPGEHGRVTAAQQGHHHHQWVVDGSWNARVPPSPFVLPPPVERAVMMLKQPRAPYCLCTAPAYQTIINNCYRLLLFPRHHPQEYKKKVT